MKHGIAVIGMACEYPDAPTPEDLFKNALAGRQSFRRMPPERLNLDDYGSADRNATDKTYAFRAALLQNYQFDRTRFRIAPKTFASTDLTHWLALDVAHRALTHAGYADGSGLPRETTAVLIGNSLTGEFSRAEQMRLRWPYVRRILASGLRKEGLSTDLPSLLQRLEREYKQPFQEINEETLAGGLANTIAGRICNFFDFGGGGFAVDGACASSLLAICQGCSALAAGDVNVVLAGGVDLSLDPFELVGFARTGALAGDRMRVYDAGSDGFIPGEGCGAVLLKRYADAQRDGDTIHAVIRGWGVSSDGKGGLTRPAVRGQILALKRAYERAGIAPSAVPYFEGHGTGTTIGDEVELSALTQVRGTSNVAPAWISSLKANIGHTKAAAGVAGFIKAVMALKNQVIPPSVGTRDPHPILKENPSGLSLLKKGLPWPSHVPLRAGVSAMGFGGINTHLVLDGLAVSRTADVSPQLARWVSSSQDAELLVWQYANADQLERALLQFRQLADNLSFAELSDLGRHLSESLQPGPFRAAMVVSSAEGLTEGLDLILSALKEGSGGFKTLAPGVYLGNAPRAPKIGFLFPGQTAPVYRGGGAFERRFSELNDLFESHAALPLETQTQQQITRTNLAGLALMEKFGIEADVAIGHSLGELAALDWAGVMDPAQVLQLVQWREEAVNREGRSGSMMTLATDPSKAAELVRGTGAVIAVLNTSRNTVISGTGSDLNVVAGRCRDQRIAAVALPLPHGFHSPLLSGAREAFEKSLKAFSFKPPIRRLFSTITGSALVGGESVRDLLGKQLTHACRFSEAWERAAGTVDVWVEVGPGVVLGKLVSGHGGKPVLVTDIGSEALAPFLQTLAQLFAMGSPVAVGELYGDRFTRDFDLETLRFYLTNPCEKAPLPVESEIKASDLPPDITEQPQNEIPTHFNQGNGFEVFLDLLARHVALPRRELQGCLRMLDDLHLNSIRVAELVTRAAATAKLPAPVAPTDYANASLSEIEEAFCDLALMGDHRKEVHDEGLAPWVRFFNLRWVVQEQKSGVGEDPGPFALIGSRDLGDLPLRSHGEAGPAKSLVVVLPSGNEKVLLNRLLETVARLRESSQLERVLLVQDRPGCSSFARCLHMERPELSVGTVCLPFDHSLVSDWIFKELETLDGFADVAYDNDGTRRVNRVTLASLQTEPEKGQVLLKTDVVLVTGGGKGIAAECALRLGRETGATLLLMGRADPAVDQVLADNLKRFRELQISFSYCRADVSQGRQVADVLREVQAKHGPVTALIHGAGINRPKLMGSLDLAGFNETLAPKLGGFRNLMASLDTRSLKLVVAFGSILARTGLRGEADYALANEWLALEMDRFAANHPHCRCINMEWSVWAGVGMGDRLGTQDSLAAQGIAPLSVDRGVAAFSELIGQDPPQTSVIISSRFGLPPTLPFLNTQLPFLRFIERVRVHYPGVELVVDCQVGRDTDPYVDDHRFGDTRIFPLVMVLEAMAQVASGVTGLSPKFWTFEDLALDQPLLIPEQGSLVVRLAALVKRNGAVDLVLRSGGSGFHVDHVRTTLTFAEEPFSSQQLKGPKMQPLFIDPKAELYGPLLFHRGRFRRIEAYEQLTAYEYWMKTGSPTHETWFSHILPGETVLGDPAARDATLHGAMACLPHREVLPARIGSIRISTVGDGDRHWVNAREVGRQEDLYFYDLDVINENGGMVEQWRQVAYKSVAARAIHDHMAPALLGPMIQRRVCEHMTRGQSTDFGFAVEYQPKMPRSERRRLLAQRCGLGKLLKRGDGKPQTKDGRKVSFAHEEDLSIIAWSSRSIACDLLLAPEHSPRRWKELLGERHFSLTRLMVESMDEPLHVAAARVWTVLECLKKVGESAVPIFRNHEPDGWVWFACGPFQVITLGVQNHRFHRPLVLAALYSQETEFHLTPHKGETKN